MPGPAAGRSRNFTGAWPRTPGRLVGTAAIRFYQLTLSGFVGNGCRHHPTCSEYGYEAIARHGLWQGGWLALFRVARCGPWGTHGIDLVPDALAPGSRWWAPWRLRLAALSPLEGEMSPKATEAVGGGRARLE